MTGYYKKTDDNKIEWIEINEPISFTKSQMQSIVPVDKTLADVTAPEAIEIPPMANRNDDAGLSAISGAAKELLSQQPRTALPQNVMAAVRDILNSLQDTENIRPMLGDQVYAISGGDVSDNLWNAAVDMAYEKIGAPTPPLYVSPQVY